MILREDLDQALRLLKKDAFVLIVHDAQFPSRAHEDLGRGSPYSHGAADFLRFARDLGFDGLQLGPQGITSRGNPSPYDGTLFSKNPQSIALEKVAEETPFLSAAEIESLASHRPVDRDRVPYEWTFDHHAEMRAKAFARFASAATPEDASVANDPRVTNLRQAYAAFVAEAGPAWLEADLGAEPGVTTDHAREQFRFEQFLVHRQHAAWRTELKALGVTLYGDWQIGLSPRDAAAHRVSVLANYAMGAPPSRTNPDGQAWGYPILNPDWMQPAELDPPGDPSLAHTRTFLETRLSKAVADYDALRLDHPHGWVDPWAYRTDDGDPNVAVRHGARLFGSPNLPDHPAIARFAVAEASDIDEACPRYADHWVKSLTQAQIDLYARAMDLVIRNSGGASKVTCEVLSTQPYPLGCVMERHGLGRFRVTQKSDVTRPEDVYRSDRAIARDWIMMGNHDTEPMWRVVQRWTLKTREARARYLAPRLLGPGEHDEWVTELMTHEHALVQAEFADLFVSEAAHVIVFFPDLFGMLDVYNMPGIVSDANWRLRIPHDYPTRYEHARADHKALDLPYALALALRARGLDQASPELFARLKAAAARPLP